MMNNRYGTQSGFRPRPPNRFNQGPTRQTIDKLISSIRASQTAIKAKVVEVSKTALKNASFEDFHLDSLIQKNVTAKKYTTPTPIQDQTIPHILEGRDIIGIANTGTGKTAAFLLPLIHKVLLNRQEKVLIITPTRELGLQINQEFNDFARGLGIYSALCIGGTSMFRQKNDLRRTINFVIGTPGRIKDLVQSKRIFLSEFHNVVLDEADRMVDIGFIGDIKYFITLLPTNRQSLFFSATISNKERDIIADFVKNPVSVSVKQQETAEKIDQQLVHVITKEKKIEQLHDLLNKKEFNKVLIFGRTKHGIQKLTNDLIDRGFKAGAIHGNKSQNQRQNILNQFKRDEITILLATDVASRGLDIPDVSHVINYEIPNSYEDYVHRIGRTGRANQSGVALTFID